MNASSRSILAAALSLAASTAFAQADPLTGIPPAPVITIAAPTCERPATTAGLNPNPTDSKRWNKQIEDYKKCMVAYQKSLGDSINAYTMDVNAMVNSAKKTLEDFNGFAKQVRKDNDMDDDDDSGKK